MSSSLASSRLRWLPLVLTIGAMASIWICLGRAASTLSQPINWPRSPPISALADTSGGFFWFSTGFSALAVLLSGALVCRAAHISATLSSAGARPAHHYKLNAAWLLLALLAVPFILLMAFNRDDGPTSGLHYLGAGVGMGLICLSGVLHAALCLCTFRVDRMMPSSCLRASLYTCQLVGQLAGGACFGVWLAGDKSDATLEWYGFLCVLGAYASYAIFFLYRPLPQGAYVTRTREELLAASRQGQWQAY